MWRIWEGENKNPNENVPRMQKAEGQRKLGRPWLRVVKYHFVMKVQWTSIFFAFVESLPPCKPKHSSLCTPSLLITESFLNLLNQGLKSFILESTDMGMIRWHEQFLKNYSIRCHVRHWYDIDMTQMQHKYDTLNELFVTLYYSFIIQ